MAMNSGQGLVGQLKREYFWDVDVSKLDSVKSSRLIIERILNYRSIREISLMTKAYGKVHMIDTICQICYFDPKRQFIILYPKNM